MRVSEIRVKRIRVNQGLGVCFFVGPTKLYRSHKLTEKPRMAVRQSREG